MGAALYPTTRRKTSPRVVDHRSGRPYHRNLGPDRRAFQIRTRKRCIVFDLIKEEGLCLGGSSGINIAGAIRMARDLGPGHTIVTVLADYGTRYITKLFNPAFLKEKGLPSPDWL
jgi:cysteine synthase A